MRGGGGGVVIIFCIESICNLEKHLTSQSGITILNFFSSSSVFVFWH